MFYHLIEEDYKLQLLFKELGIDLEVDVDLHEWVPDIINFQHKTSQDSFDLCMDFNLYNGIPPKDELKVWETAESMKKEYIEF